jgi:hypothetical protein
MKTMHLKWKPRQVAHGFPRVISVSARNNTGDKKCQEKKSAGKTHPKWPKLVMCQRDVLWNEWDGICLFLRFDDNRSRQQGTKMVDDDANDDQR